MPYCQGCQTMTGYDELKVESEGPPQVEPADVRAGTFTVTSNVKLTLECAECGQPVREGYLELEEEGSHDCLVTVRQHDDTDEDEVGPSDDRFPHDDVAYEVSTEDPEPMDRYQTMALKRRKRKDGTVKVTTVQVRNPRYQKHFYGATQDLTVTCGLCQEEIQVHLEDDMQASSMEEV